MSSYVVKIRAVKEVLVCFDAERSSIVVGRITTLRVQDRFASLKLSAMSEGQ